MSAAIIDELRSVFDATTVLTGSDIDARYHTDMAGVPVAPIDPQAAGGSFRP